MFPSTCRFGLFGGLILTLWPLSLFSSGRSAKGITRPGIELHLSSSSLTIREGSSAKVTVDVLRTGSTGDVTFSLKGLPAGVTASYQNPMGTGQGQIAIMATTAAEGAYPLTLQASDGADSASSSIRLVVKAGGQAVDPYAWRSTGPLISAIPDATHPIVSVKDPTAVYYKNSWNVYATTADTSGKWNMVYLRFTNWDKASAARPYYMDATPGLSGYHCAPELFYFTPQKKWYLIYQSGPPQFSTADDPTRPETWTAPKSFFARDTSVNGWLDFWAICDSANCYLFFTDDGGDFYRSQTSLSNFPGGFSTPQLIMHAASRVDLFESGRTYRIKGSTKYLTVIECMGGNSGRRYYRAFLADTLDGLWTPMVGADSFATPFLGDKNVSFAPGSAWTNDLSHGEILRNGYDEHLEIDPQHLQFLYQGVDPATHPSSYSQIPYQLGIATATEERHYR